MKRHTHTFSAARSIALPAIALVIAAPPAALAATAHDAGHATAKPAATAARHALRHEEYRATQLIGKTVRSRQNVEMGTITDLVLNMDTGHVRYAVLSLKGEVGPGEPRLYAIPVSKLEPGARRGDIVLDVNASLWREKSGFRASRWPDLHDRGYWDEIDRLSGAPAVQPAESYFAFRASELIGKPVRNVEGHRLGAVRDLMIDLNRQKVRYVGMEFAPGAAATGRLYSFPVAAFAFPEDKAGDYRTGTLVLNEEPADLAKMKSFDAAHWPGLRPRIAPDTVARNSVR